MVKHGELQVYIQLIGGALSECILKRDIFQELLSEISSPSCDEKFNISFPIIAPSTGMDSIKINNLGFLFFTLRTHIFIFSNSIEI